MTPKWFRCLNPAIKYFFYFKKQKWRKKNLFFSFNFWNFLNPKQKFSVFLPSISGFIFNTKNSTETPPPIFWDYYLLNKINKQKQKKCDQKNKIGTISSPRYISYYEILTLKIFLGHLIFFLVFLILKLNLTTLFPFYCVYCAADT